MKRNLKELKYFDTMKMILLISLAAILLLAFSGCTTDPGNTGIINSAGTSGLDSQTSSPVLTPTSNQTPVPITTPVASLPDYKERLTGLVDSNSAFGFDLYRMLRGSEGGNLFYSPYSISSALAMVYAGARGDTATQMASTLYFTQVDDMLHPTFKQLAQLLDSRSTITGNYDYKPDTPDQTIEVFRLNIANALWGQKDYPFLPAYLDLVNANYDAGLKSLDFIRTPEPSRQEINRWVSDKTEGKIEDLILPGDLDNLTRLVLTNAVYFNARWTNKFLKEDTHDGPFYLVDGAQATVPLMEQTHVHYDYYKGKYYQAISLPYMHSDFSMVILLPEEGQFANFEKSLDLPKYYEILKGMRSTEVNLTLPKYKYESRFELGEVLSEMGMKDAFSLGAADFSGMTGNRELYISGVEHQAAVSVDEEGTEAAAATVVRISLCGGGLPIDFTINRPFIFLIRDSSSGAILFMGRVMDPRM